MIYILRGVDGTILGAGEKDDWVPAPGQTVEALETTLAEYAGHFRLGADRTAIRADGVEAATVTVSMGQAPAPPSVDVLVNGAPFTVPLAGGVGTLLVSAEASGALVVEPADPATFCRAGEGTLVIRAEEGV